MISPIADACPTLHDGDIKVRIWYVTSTRSATISDPLVRIGWIVGRATKCIVESQTR